MESKWGPFGLCLWSYILLISACGIQQSCSLNDEEAGLALLKFRLTDPYGALANWNSNDYAACKWSGAHCVDGKVNMLLACGNTIEVVEHYSSLKTSPHLRNRKLAQWFKTEKASSHGIRENNCVNLPGSDGIEIAPSTSNLVNTARRRLLDESSSNLAAAPFAGAPVPISSVPTTLSSGSFPAVPVSKQTDSPNSPPSSSNSPPKDSPSSNENGSSPWKIVVIVICVLILVIFILVLLWIWRKRAVKVIKPWRTGISGQLQKAFVTGVPKLNRAELETACEDFSNIIYDLGSCTIYKGTLSSGVEIAVASTTITSPAHWTKGMEMAYRKKLDILSRINHKNFTNLIGYCDEEQPFTRMMVFEFAPSGTLYDHLNVPEVEHLDWSARMRVIMGTAYCLQYMHHDLNPPIAHSELSSDAILLTDDFAAKIAEVVFCKNVVSPTKTTEGESKQYELPPECCPENDVYRFGVLLLEIITGKLPYQDHGNLTVLADWAAKYLREKTSDRSIVDPTLQSFKDEELSVIFDVIHECTQSDASLRPTMKDVTLKLRDALKISPDQAVPRLSPLWWAELEILSMEGT
ncbi:protein MALE DISCOVERER 2 isoform X1 [Arachis duranensis]|uniref:Protein MALE DISCOVERER 2 isoform X1 n=1 Tax=Arachis duranensis TaxID=130453 RepID=A0A6P4CXK6_ARADU|nr:protein MALE DISCOVERER 2 isoform X1 [Arachis duranensis]XP_015958150.1 protein MALE DISCOVERER 2 isoform X1 [Arachis duranensis]XP_015958153.1 protein MALE DISCOVERER 2 isoform X1 [Arachis duranensis]XP_052114668.1 protein MALE DISCOVERER 2 isoform X1 [Arachis duranensis]